MKIKLSHLIRVYWQFDRFARDYYAIFTKKLALEILVGGIVQVSKKSANLPISFTSNAFVDENLFAGN